MARTTRTPQPTAPEAPQAATGTPATEPTPAPSVEPTEAPTADPGPAFETITDGPTTYRVTEDGKARLSRPHWYREGTIRPYTLPKAPRARVEPADAYRARLTATFGRAVDKAKRRGGGDREEAVIGQSAGAGYVIVATDGRSALLRKGEPTRPGHGYAKLAVPAKGAEWFTLPADFALAVARMRAANPGDAKHDPVLSLRVEKGIRVLHLFTRDPHDDTEAREWIPLAIAPKADARALLNLRHVSDALGLSGQRIYLGQDGKPAMIDSADGEYRVLTMPYPAKYYSTATDSPQTVDEEQIAAALAPAPAPAPKPRRELSEGEERGIEELGKFLEYMEGPDAPTKGNGTYREPEPVTDDVTQRRREAARKAVETRRARLAAGGQVPMPKPQRTTGSVDWRAAGLKAWATRQRNLAARAAAVPQEACA